MGGTARSNGRRVGWMAATLPVLLVVSALSFATPSGAAAPTSLFATPTGSGTQTCASPANACTLSKALVEAGPGTTIDLVQAGESRDPGTWYDGGFSVDTAGTSPAKPVTINGEGDAIIDGTGSEVDLTVGPTYLDLVGVSVDGSGHGPGLRNDDGGSVTVTSSTFDGDANSADYGGAIDNSDTLLPGTVGRDTLTVVDSTFTSDSSLEGGAIFNEDGTVDVTGSTFDSDEADASGGGAIVNGRSGIAGEPPGILEVSDSTFEHNGAPTLGGAIDNADGAPGNAVIANSTFYDNISGNFGGAIANGFSSGNGTLSVKESTFDDNQTAQNGGAIDNGDFGRGILTVLHSTFSGDVASGDGTAIDSDDNGGTGGTTLGGDLVNDNCAHPSGSWVDLGYDVSSNTSCFGGPGDVDVATLYADLSSLETLDSPLQVVVPTAGSTATGTIPDGIAKLCPIAGDERGMPSPSAGPCNAGAVQDPGGAVVQLLPSQLPASPGDVSYKVVVQGSLGLAPTGSVQIEDNHAGICGIGSLSADGPSGTDGACAISGESAHDGPYTITATYFGNSTYGDSSTSIVESEAVASKTGTASETQNNVTVTASGGKSGASDVIVAKYVGNPEAASLPGASTFFDVAQGAVGGGAQAPRSTAHFKAVKVVDCDKVTSSTQLFWWGTKNKHHEWLPVIGKPGPTYAKGKPSCLAVTLTSSSSPSVAQLTGTAFGATAPKLAIAGSTIIEPRVHRLGRVELTATGGNAPYKWKLITGKLPKLLSLSSSGVLSGTPQAAGTTTVVVEITDTGTSTTPQVHVVVTLQIVVLPPAPVVTSINPASGSANGGTSVTIDGTSLKGATAVLFGAVAAATSSIKVNAAGTVLTVTTPAHAAGSVGVSVTTLGGTSATKSYKFTT